MDPPLACTFTPPVVTVTPLVTVIVLVVAAPFTVKLPVVSFVPITMELAYVCQRRSGDSTTVVVVTPSVVNNCVGSDTGTL
jgi:hypothetical protein